MNAGEHLDEGRFARAVLAAKRVDFAGAQIEADVLQRDDARETF